MDTNQQKRNTFHANVSQKITTESDVLASNSSSNPYINNDSIAVHL